MISWYSTNGRKNQASDGLYRGITNTISCQQELDQRRRRQHDITSIQSLYHEYKDTNNTLLPPPPPKVHIVCQAGHLLMLDNLEEMNAGVIRATGGDVPMGTHIPIKVCGCMRGGTFY